MSNDQQTAKVAEVYSEIKATDHYLSPKRRDGVKVNWEEPFSCAVFRKAIEESGYKRSEPLRVVDVGCGTGDCLALLSNPAIADAGLYSTDNIRYVGLDISSDMIETAKDLHRGDDRTRFYQSDILQGFPSEPFDLYLSSGVPYSHLTAAELHKVLCDLFTKIKRNCTQSVAVIDVLGRLSIEWVPHWSEDRWDYRMSFFNSDSSQDGGPTMMNFYSSEHLGKIIKRAAAEVGCNLVGMEFFDRSIMVGRHTSTGHFNPDLPRYRNLVNSLIDPEKTTSLTELLFQVELGNAPENILGFFKTYSNRWNTLVAQAASVAGESLDVTQVNLPPQVANFTEVLKRAVETSDAANPRASVLEPMLSSYLQRLESFTQQGLGVGHSLICLVHVDES